ncbi:MAG TPA: hypothetical protein VIM96_01820 [Pseudomonadales bacterium]
MRFGWSLLFLLGLLAAVWWSLSDEERARLSTAIQAKSTRLQSEADAGVTVPPLATTHYVRMEYPAVSGQCTPRQAASKAVIKPGVYRWQDEKSRWHYGDKAPKTAKVDDLSHQFPVQAKHITVKVIAEGGDLAVGMRDQLNRDAERIFRFYSAHLPSADARSMTLTVHAFFDQKRFEQWRESRDQSSTANAGLYDAVSREAAVMLSGDTQWDAGVMRHEITHAIHYELLARPPIWFDEGMAEIFNMLSYHDGHWQADTWRVPHVSRLAGATAGDMMTEWDRSDWPGSDPALSYARAWSMAAFLLSAHDGRIFTQYLQWLEAHYCQRLDSRAFMDEHYPGGLAQWQRDWQVWLQQQSTGERSAVWWSRLPTE